MGILNKFKTPLDNTLKNGSKYGPKYTADNKLPEFKLAGKTSPLHAEPNGKEGYSLNGENESNTQKLYNEYDDGQANALPPASTLDDISKNLYTSTKKYTNPEESTGEGAPTPGAIGV